MPPTFRRHPSTPLLSLLFFLTITITAILATTDQGRIIGLVTATAPERERDTTGTSTNSAARGHPHIHYHGEQQQEGNGKGSDDEKKEKGGCRKSWVERFMGCECDGGGGGNGNGREVGRFGFVCGARARGEEVWEEKRGKVVRKQEEGRVWGESGAGWEVRIELRTEANTPSVSPLDWSVRWNDAKKCLSSPEFDNEDNFEIDELALKSYWDRAWMCFLPYVIGESEVENNGVSERSTSAYRRSHDDSHTHEAPGITSPQSSAGVRRYIAGMRLYRLVLFIVGIMVGLMRWGLECAIDQFAIGLVFTLDLAELALAWVWWAFSWVLE
ncbi:hypothetical protein FQN54_007342 [Arachnomyces sp. PD_36]|nr:hypothetical protein FQN54_007342 [Arachnomyces sp. PD_36]